MGRGRPPIGDKALSSAERQRRFLDKIRGSATSSSQLEAECAKLKRENFVLKSENSNLQRHLNGAYEHIKEIEARRERPAPKPKAQISASETEQKLRRKINQLRRHLRDIQHSPKGTVFMKPGDRRAILSALHPDGVENPAAKRRCEIAFQIVNQLFDSGNLREVGEDAPSDRAT